MLLIFSGCAGSGQAVVIPAQAGTEAACSGEDDAAARGQGADLPEAGDPASGDPKADDSGADDPEAGFRQGSFREENLRETAATEAGTESPAPGIVVHICGQVVCPGVYELSEGSRVWDGVQAAGGFLEEADQEAVNLAAPLSDGCKITIPSEGESGTSDWYEADGRAEAAGSSQTEDGGLGIGPSGAADGLVDINRASVSELMELSGIGQVRAEAIIAYRESHGLFRTKEEIMNVTGIKEGLFAKIKDHITVGG